MRHFAHHIGDYAAATAHLTMIEDAAYHRLLRLYYQNERPLPADENEVMRRVRAASRSEKNAVRRMLTEFFTLSSDGWHQSRADKEISTYKGLVEAGREGGIKSGVARSLKQNRTNQEPLTKNQEPLTKEDKITRDKSRRTTIDPDWEPSADELAYAAEHGSQNPPDTAEQFKLHHLAKGTLALSWPASFKFWCRNQKNFARPQQAQRNGYSAPSSGGTVIDDEYSLWRARLRGYTPDSLWLWGPRPGEAGCQVPAPILAAWRAAA